MRRSRRSCTLASNRTSLLSRLYPARLTRRTTPFLGNTLTAPLAHTARVCTLCRCYVSSWLVRSLRLLYGIRSCVPSEKLSLRPDVGIKAQKGVLSIYAKVETLSAVIRFPIQSVLKDDHEHLFQILDVDVWPDAFPFAIAAWSTTIESHIDCLGHLIRVPVDDCVLLAFRANEDLGVADAVDRARKYNMGATMPGSVCCHDSKVDDTVRRVFGNGLHLIGIVVIVDRVFGLWRPALRIDNNDPCPGLCRCCSAHAHSSRAEQAYYMNKDARLAAFLFVPFHAFQHSIHATLVVCICTRPDYV